MRYKLISIILILIILTACVVAKMPTISDGVDRLRTTPEPTPTLGLVRIGGAVMESVGESVYISVYDPYPAPGLPVPYP